MSSVYDNYLKEHNFSLRLEQWAKQYKNKKVILYGCGLLFDKIVELYDIKNKLNIVAVCDVKYEKNKPDTYLGFKTIKPSDLSKTDYDVLIFTVFDHLTCLNYLNTFDFFHENKEFRYINEMALKGKFISFILKAKTAAKYLAFTKNPFKTAKYFFSCNNIEFNSKLNYQKVLKRLRKKKDKIKVIFIVESNQKWGWQSVYDELKKDSRFELLLVTLPLTTRFKDKIYPQKEDIEFFSQRNMPIIDGYDYKNEICIDLKELGADIIFTHIRGLLMCTKSRLQSPRNMPLPARYRTGLISLKANAGVQQHQKISVLICGQCLQKANGTNLSTKTVQISKTKIFYL